MPLFDKQTSKIHFIHIPRTGGRYVTKLFEHNDFHVKHGDVETMKRIDGILEAHLYYPLYKCLDSYEERREFCIVRNPLDRFISAITQMHYYWGTDYNYILESPEKFNNFLFREIHDTSKHNCWFLAQHKFISNKTKVWKYENRFSHRFLRWINKNLDVDLKNIPNKNCYSKHIWSNTSYTEDIAIKKYKFKDMKLLKKYVRNFYKKDYEIFKY